MGVSAQESVINALKKYLSKGWLEKAKKTNPEFAAAVQNMPADNVSFGPNPTIVAGYVKGGCTASGESTYESTTTKRTVSINFTTDTAVFMAKSNSASVDACKKAVKVFPEIKEYGSLRSLSECENMAEEHGRTLARNDLSDLDFSMKEYRLNRYEFVPVTNVFKVDLWQIFGWVSVNGKIKQFSMGYWYEKDGEKVVDLDIKVPLTGRQKLIIFGVIAATLLALVILFKLLK